MRNKSLKELGIQESGNTDLARYLSVQSVRISSIPHFGKTNSKYARQLIATRSVPRFTQIGKCYLGFGDAFSTQEVYAFFFSFFLLVDIVASFDLNCFSFYYLVFSCCHGAKWRDLLVLFVHIALPLHITNI